MHKDDQRRWSSTPAVTTCRPCWEPAASCPKAKTGTWSLLDRSNLQCVCDAWIATRRIFHTIRLQNLSNVQRTASDSNCTPQSSSANSNNATVIKWASAFFWRRSHLDVAESIEKESCDDFRISSGKWKQNCPRSKIHSPNRLEKTWSDCHYELNWFTVIFRW